MLVSWVEVSFDLYIAFKSCFKNIQAGSMIDNVFECLGLWVIKHKLKEKKLGETEQAIIEDNSFSISLAMRATEIYFYMNSNIMTTIL